MNLEIILTNQAEKDLKRAKKQDKNLDFSFDIVNLLIKQESLPERNKDHNLSGNYANYRECHILPDWLIIYRVEKSLNQLIIYRTGSHSELFK